MGPWIHYAQWGMTMEIVHAFFRLVPSPFVPTFMQVFSRLALMLVVMFAPTTRTTWHCGMMAISWSLVEVRKFPSPRTPEDLKFCMFVLGSVGSLFFFPLCFSSWFEM